MIKIKKKTFSGTSKVFRGELGPAIRGVAQYQAAAKLDTAPVTALANSAGGTANGTINAIGNVTPAVLGTTDCHQKAGFETALVTVKDAAGRVVSMPGTREPRADGVELGDNLADGATADGTVGAIGVVLTGVGTSLASAAGSGHSSPNSPPNPSSAQRTHVQRRGPIQPDPEAAVYFQFPSVHPYPQTYPVI